MADEIKNDENADGGAPGDKLTEIAKVGGVTTKNAGGSIHCLSIIGQIEGHYVLDSTQKTTKYEHVLPLLCAIEENEEIDGLLLLLNTMGGDVEAGLAIAELVASMKTPTVTLVLGGGHSIGVPLAVCGRRSFIVPSATMTLHPVRTTGTVIGVPQTFYYFDKMQDRIISFICAHSHVDEDNFRAMMNNTSELANDVGTIIDGYEAVNCGLIDEVGGLSQALAALRGLIKAEK
ncbi:MAG: ATP-dependent Clp protease proteolytic subunit [Clostridia bacterium]|nr:ATP-dependent Clp protease proteolytic subunit [Clostridia bacterium]